MHIRRHDGGQRRGLSREDKEKIAKERQRHIEKNLRILKERGVTDETISALMGEWDVLPDAIVYEINKCPGYHAYTEFFLQLRDALGALDFTRDTEVIWTPPPPRLMSWSGL